MLMTLQLMTFPLPLLSLLLLPLLQPGSRAFTLHGYAPGAELFLGRTADSAVLPQNSNNSLLTLKAIFVPKNLTFLAKTASVPSQLIAPKNQSLTINEGGRLHDLKINEADTVSPIPNFLGEGSSSLTYSIIPTKSTRLSFPLLRAILMMLAAVLACLGVCHMIPGADGGASQQTNYRVPPTWSPEGERTYPFRAYVRDLLL